MMPGALNPTAAEGLTATYQFDVSGSENFSAHLVIVDGQATFHEGAADHPNITIKTPAECGWPSPGRSWTAPRPS